MWFTRTSKIEIDRRALLVWLSLFAVAPIPRSPALGSFGLSRRAGGPKTARPHLPCPQAPLQSITAAASLSIPVLALPSADPFGSAPSRGCEHLPAPKSPCRRTDEDRAPTRRPEPLDAAPIRARQGHPRRGRTRHVSMGGGRDTIPKVHAGPPERRLSAEAERNRCQAPSNQSGKPPSADERARGAWFVSDNTSVDEWLSSAPSEVFN